MKPVGAYTGFLGLTREHGEVIDLHHHERLLFHQQTRALYLKHHHKSSYLPQMHNTFGAWAVFLWMSG